MRFYFFRQSLRFSGNIFLLAAILCAAFAPAFSAVEKTPSGMVFCPLTHQFQPIKAREKTAFGSLEEICASEKLKDKFSSQLFVELTAKVFQSNQTNTENLAFNFWKQGKSAFDSVPNTPDSTENYQTKNSPAAINFGSRDDDKIVFKIWQSLVFQIKPRPPADELSDGSKFPFSKNLEEISRQIAPRAPPLFS